MLRAACIGTREPSPEWVGRCETLGGYLVRLGWVVSTGNAPGVDQAFARGANQYHPERVQLSLPWPKFESQAIHPQNQVRSVQDLESGELIVYEALAHKYHPRYQYLTQGAKKLMIRNSMIMMGPLVDVCLALPSEKKGGGGTGQGMRIAAGHNVEVVDLRSFDQSQLFQLCERLTQWPK
jgi:hypothetical protein